ncbi:multidrug efflux SMR transporter [Campylobacter lari]|uniref:DMT family transporter n=1 Tax=Campylobacter lari TaxID=201 RepID=UPI0017EE15FA|nr:multidrug efflux SMR transporter [Campylobacter lari]EAH5177509.1 QacE family quaternary ammonium compound efflux SMR transporter [Campylobacter lari]ECL7012114.1 multidrug efflux SMR transporter [Campylobacter lari]ECL7012730.1 multidrug efflux SMR transporter [Campylobacter lari]EDC2882003.1 multidrug efflux SMR transporter [Campylobacter lari]MCV3550068.1 multidrug efflux SMR transporter [Campylobacter lari]
MEWFFLFLATAFEIFGVIIMKQLVITKNKFYLLALIVCFAFSFGFLSLSMQSIAMSVAYSIWTGVGTAGGVIIGVVFYKENKSFLKLFLIALIIACTIGLKLLS